MEESGSFPDEDSELEEYLSPKELRERLTDPNFLPTHKQIEIALPTLREWASFFMKKDTPPLDVFELLNEEYLDALSDYLVEKITEYGASKENPLLILEIGAGDGRLSHFLRQKLEKKAPGLTKIIATDSGEWGLKSHFPVEKLKHDEALKKYDAQVVLCSWMPWGVDQTEDIRRCKKTREYILIGESDGGQCGDNWKTWGIKAYDDPSEDRQVPPYKAEGFEKKDMGDLRKHQVCGTDYPGEFRHSTSVSFKRIA